MSSSLIKSVSGKARKAASAGLLRGPVFRKWVSWRTDKLVSQYRQLLLKSCDKNVRSNAPRPVAPRPQLKKLLFITDGVWERRELLPELSRLCEVSFVDVHPLIHRQSAPPYENISAARILAELEPHRNEPYDCILVYLRRTLLSEELIHHLRKTWKCPLVGLNLDCKTTFEDYKVFRGEPDGYRHWAGNFDCNLTNAKAMVDVYAAAGFNSLYLPTGFHFDPAIHRLRPDTNFEIGISFVGSCKPDRRIVIDELKRMKIPVQVFGGGWKGQPFIKDGYRIFQQTQLNLGIGFNVADVRITNLKNRDFECPGAGGCYLTTYDWELAGLYDIGREILCYRSMDDLVELYTYYIRRPDECLRIAAAGFERCKREHTWEQRFRKSFEQLGFKPHR